MNITVFKGSNGDCLLLTGRDGTNILVDGGRTTAYEKHVAPTLGAMHAAGQKLDLVCVSHIDDDHISGIVAMLDHKVAWKVHAFQRAHGNTKHRQPKVPEPPDIAHIWHNGFSDTVKDNDGAIVDQLATRASYLSMETPGAPSATAEVTRNLLHGEERALKLRDRISERQLGIPINAPFDGRLMALYDDTEPFPIGGLSVRLIGPYFEDLEVLRTEWNRWVAAHAKKVAELRERAREEEADLGLAGVDAWVHRVGRLAAELGEVGELTPPNVASLMFVVEEGQRRIVMTGDGGWDVILGGLEHAGLMLPGEGLHVGVLKVPHHGSRHNVSQDMLRRLTADHYIFCANGSYGHPDVDTIRALLASRLGGEEARSTNEQAAAPFKIWLTYGPDHDVTPDQKAHLRKVVPVLQDAVGQHSDRVSVEFIEGDAAVITI